MKEVRCPTCDGLLNGPNPSKLPYFPFCSSRCRLIDLGRWLGERYRIEAEAEVEAAVDPDQEQDPP